MKDRYSTRWTKAKDMVTEETFQLTNLKENNEYQFRVIAENKAGPGEPSPAVNVTAKFEFGEYFAINHDLPFVYDNATL